MSTMAERIQEAVAMVRRFDGTMYERAAAAYLAAQVDIAKRQRFTPRSEA